MVHYNEKILRQISYGRNESGAIKITILSILESSFMDLANSEIMQFRIRIDIKCEHSN